MCQKSLTESTNSTAIHVVSANAAINSSRRVPMFVRKSWIAILVYVLCHSGVAVAQRPDPAIGSNWPNGTWATVVGGGNGDRTTIRDASGRSLGTAV